LTINGNDIAKQVIWIKHFTVMMSAHMFIQIYTSTHNQPNLMNNNYTAFHAFCHLADTFIESDLCKVISLLEQISFAYRNL